ncbi:MAG: hypothetical protein AVDCRST_MAG30-4630 [uncultured Solirubrobacteraceae bacterium]|uniref:Uncharacterized protein n=1 Tax=uncultured Solirubrobacteraceae bacterium TaxID=1162706 RepID=A0A6J4U3C9_9ACTN|nr:MAG: hypothetical protein AVDCRST_MAG30-4630 [uncultured Solirubrobacteraceae bacterium]
MLSRPTLALAALLLALALAACGGDDAPAPPKAGSGAQPLEGELRYERSGGFSGRMDEVVIAPDGSATLASSGGEAKPFRLTPAELDSLRSAAAAADLASVPADAGTGATPDDFGHRIDYRGRTVRTDDSSLPEALAPLVGELGELVERHAEP